VRLSAVLGLAMLATLAAAPGTRAQLAVETIANYAGLDRQRILEQGARREGSLLLYTTGTQIKPLIDRFEQKYPYVKVELAQAPPTPPAR
jgi:iron(III) transport system substrate-binding protein